MSSVHFTPMLDLWHEPQIIAMMNALYGEDHSAPEPDRSRFPLTIRTLLSEPHRGRILLFLEGKDLRGYAILIPFWSNEFGGTVVLIDELFVQPETRNRGIGRRFLDFVADTRPFEAVAAMLEVSPTNPGARRLYESLGFSQRQNFTLIRRFPPIR